MKLAANIIAFVNEWVEHVIFSLIAPMHQPVYVRVCNESSEGISGQRPEEVSTDHFQ